MIKQPWFKLFIWIIATSFFFLASCVLISILSPAPDEEQTINFMSGMMAAMHNSLMGLSMTLETDTELKLFIGRITSYTIILIQLSIILGIYYRFVRVKNNG